MKISTDTSLIRRDGEPLDIYLQRLADVIEYEGSRILNFNHTNWYMHKDPKNFPCAFCRLMDAVRLYVHGVDDYLGRCETSGMGEDSTINEESEEINSSKSAIGSSP